LGIFKDDIVFNVPLTMFTKDVGFLQMNEFVRQKAKVLNEHQEFEREASMTGSTASQALSEKPR